MNRCKVVLALALSVAAGCHGRPDPRMPADATVLQSFKDPYVKAMNGQKYVVYESKSDGPPVIILHEGPGMVYEDIRLGQNIASRGFKVYMPLMFGKAGERSNANLFRACVRGGFHCFRNKPAEILSWLRPFIREVSHGKPTGVIGMCLTGNVPFALLDLDVVRVAVMSQPALPMTNKSALGVTDAQVDAGRAAAKKRAAILYFRFNGDSMSPPERLAAFKSRVPEIEDHQLPAPRDGAHSVLGIEYSDKPKDDPTNMALERIIAVLKERLAS
jgi:dienelactone hydrolase